MSRGESPDASRALLELRGVTRGFDTCDGFVAVLKDLNLVIEAGEIVAIMGVSGSGKSTLMNLLGCLDRPSSGSYWVAGRDTGGLDANALAALRRDHFGFIFQRYHLLPHLGALDNVALPAAYAGVPFAPRRARAGQLLARLGLAQYGAQHPHQLSGGQQQRVSIARALVNGGEVILADEPTGALDRASGRDVLAILLELNASGHTVVIVTHDEQVASHARRIIELSDGRIVGDRRTSSTPSASANVTPPLEASIPMTTSSTSPASNSASVSALGSASIPMPRIAVTPAFARHGFGSPVAWVEACHAAWAALRAHRLRTALALLGIAIGISSVVSMAAIGAGARETTLQEIRSIGTNTIEVFRGRDWGDRLSQSIRTLVPLDLAVLQALPGVDSVTPYTERAALLRYRNVAVDAQANGVGENFFRVRGMTLAAGASFQPEQVRRLAKVAVIDANTRRKLFPHDADPIGRILLIERLPVTVIGVAQDQKNNFIGAQSLRIWLPYTTAASLLFGRDYFDGITVRVADGLAHPALEGQIEKALSKRHGRKDFFTYNINSFAQAAERSAVALSLLLSATAAISLTVGGIGVMNIMLVSVTERTREIGIRMAVGARQADIMRQFLLEAAMLCWLGGALGILMSFGAHAWFAHFVTRWQMVLSPAVLGIACGSSMLIGIVFGFIPARNAARLDPIMALARD